MTVLVAVVVLADARFAIAEGARRPNVLIILADDMGYSDAGCYGGEIATPNLDALAKYGLRFSQFYNTARCWPSRAAILTGYYAQEVRRDTLPGVKSGAQGTRPAWAKLLPEMLKPLGYRSYHSGKWHLDGKPLENGFDHSYSLNDHDRHFTPRAHTEDDKALPPVNKDAGYYSSTAIADHAIKCLKEHAAKHSGEPFFEYLAFTAPHFPVQAYPEDVAPYRKKYLAGWDDLREERWRRMQAMKLGGSVLAPIERDVGPPYAYPEAIKKLGPNELNRPLAWKDLTQAQREFQAGKMAVHAAMVDRMDREIGRVVAQIKTMKALDDTLIFFLSDNGASAEIMVRGDGHDPAAECGTGATFLSIGPGWSSLANTPFRRHKTWVHEGGISTPLIVHWPNGVKARGEIRQTPGHIIDIVPTILAAAGAKPFEIRGAPTPPGISLIPLFAKDGAVSHESLWWMHEGNRALRVGDWKIVAAGKESAWELYDLSGDRSETKNRAAEMPDKVRDMAAQWMKLLEEFSNIAKGEEPRRSSGAPVAYNSGGGEQDAQRRQDPMDYLDFRDTISAWTHGIWMVLAPPATVLLLLRSRGDRLKQLGLLIFGISLTVCFGGSFLFHAVRGSEQVLNELSIVDHLGILMLIAGTCTPIGLTILQGVWRVSLLVSVWSLAVGGGVLMLTIDLSLLQRTVLYLALGWLGCFTYFELARRVTHAQVRLVWIGGVLYTVGALLNFFQWPQVVPRLFGPHEIFHLFVMAASLCHYLFMLTVVAPFPAEGRAAAPVSAPHFAAYLADKAKTIHFSANGCDKVTEH